MTFPTPFLEYNNNETLEFDGQTISSLADKYGTPLFIYSEKAIKQALRDYLEPAGNTLLLCYAVKANSNLSILRSIFEEGTGADIVSGGELFRTLKAGVDPQKVVFSGVGKTAEEMDMAIDAGILLFSVESEAEVELLSRRAVKKGCIVKVSFRVNPDVDAETHPYISTGLKENKFGLDSSQILKIYRFAAGLKGIDPAGAGCHIGSQLTSIKVFQEAATKLAMIIRELEEAGMDVRYVDAGGGLGINYQGEKPPSHKEYIHSLMSILSEINGKKRMLIIEPGRSIIGNAGIMVTRIMFRKENYDRSFIICDAAMNDLIRPALYQAYHSIFSARKIESVVHADLVGPVCESADFLAKNRDLPDMQSGDLAVLASAGAYSFVMSSQYNSRRRAAELLILENGSVEVIRKRETYEDLIRGENLS